MYNINYFCAMPYISLYETTPESLSRDHSTVFILFYMIKCSTSCQFTWTSIMQYKMLHEIILKLHSSHDHRSEHCCRSTGMEQVHSRGQSTVITVDIFKPISRFVQISALLQVNRYGASSFTKSIYGNHGRHFKPDIIFCADQCIVACQQVWNKSIHEVSLR